MFNINTANNSSLNVCHPRAFNKRTKTLRFKQNEWFEVYDNEGSFVQSQRIHPPLQVIPKDFAYYDKHDAYSPGFATNGRVFRQLGMKDELAEFIEHDGFFNLRPIQIKRRRERDQYNAAKRRGEVA